MLCDLLRASHSLRFWKLLGTDYIVRVCHSLRISIIEWISQCTRILFGLTRLSISFPTQGSSHTSVIYTPGISLLDGPDSLRISLYKVHALTKAQSPRVSHSLKVNLYGGPNVLTH